MLIEHSNIQPHDEAKFARILDAVLQAKGWGRADVLAVSQVQGSLLVVGKSGHLLAHESGLFTKRINLGDWVSHEGVARLVGDQRGYSKSPAVRIQGLSEADTPVFQLEWGCGSDVGPDEARHERDRVLKAMLSGPSDTAA